MVARIVELRRVTSLEIDKIKRFFLELESLDGTPCGAKTGVLSMDEPHLKAVKRRSVFLQPFYLQETDHVEKTTSYPAGAPCLLPP